MITRRNLLYNGAKAIVACSSLKSLRALDQRPFHLSIADRVKKKWANKNASITVLYPKGSLVSLQKISVEFQRMTGVKVFLKEGPLDNIAAEVLLNGKLKTNKNDIDVALPATFAVPDLVEAGAIEKLNDLYDTYHSQEPGRAGLYTLGDRYKGDLYGHQTDGDTYLMFYNRPWLDNPENQKRYEGLFGRKLQVPTTWEELDQQIRFFHDPKKNRFGGSLFRTKGYSAWEFWARFHAKGYYPVSSEMVPQFNNEAGIAALEEMIKVTEFLSLSSLSDDLFSNFKSFSKGDSFCNIGWGGTQKYLNGKNSQLRNKLYFSTLPGGIKNGVNYDMPFFNWGWNYVVSSLSKNKELAYLFCLFSTSPKISTAALREAEGYFDPFKEEHYEDKVIQKVYGKDFLSVHKDSLKRCIPDFYLRGQGQYMAVLKEAVHLSILGHLPPALALQKAALSWEGITKKIGRKAQIRQWLYLRKSYPEELKKILI